MSSSGSAVPLVKLIADAQFPTATVSVMDGRYGMAGEGVGRLELSLAPGIYSVQFKAGRMVEQQTVELAEDRTVYATKLVAPAAQVAPRPAAPASNPEQGAIFISVEGDPSGQLLDQFQILDASEKTVAQFSAAQPSVALDPGNWLLRLKSDDNEAIEQTVVICKGWQLQICLRVPSSGEKVNWPHALSAAPMPMVPCEPGIATTDRDRQWIEVALDNLAANRAMAPVAELRDAVRNADGILANAPNPEKAREMLKEKFTDPMLGILGAHLLLLSPEPDRALLERVIGNLDMLVPGHPDVTALKLWLGTADPSVVFPIPPMLRSSWRIVVSRTEAMPGLVPAGSYAARAAAKLCSAGGWLVWRAPVAAVTAAAPAAPIEDLLNTVRAKVAVLTANKTSEEIRALARASGLSEAEMAIVAYLIGVDRSAAAGHELVNSLYKPGVVGTIWRFAQQLFPRVSLVSKDQIQRAADQFLSKRLSAAKMIQSFELPQSALAAALSDLAEKLPGA